ncbi:tRNA glutamyl-Q(34) synthetase GluQRS [Paraferrimonas haliotis]|uniref:Glutamyl-Q tRNA(Asp) synthetase n=1 Tax=Paraferrimonas haliotis TaxID=2013866 RepID=A0AA37TL02_9GAMM|nr:tRNA glutamyl-Q(34) synthetase GluQRS [Paraferrimonas haliotis]GLS83144.1 glutamyl-Q tRNA(Asp) synthetase [Paraferrimonas haliotis]
MAPFLISIAMTYLGRFAPSPSGPLHMGSLVAALGSYLRAKSQSGKWLVRIDDLDPPREVAGSADAILRSLEAHGLHWDDSIFYQSSRFQDYQEQLQSLLSSKVAYACDCPRKRIQALGGFYDGQCRDRQLATHQQGIRLRNQFPCYQFMDELKGQITLEPHWAEEDFLLKRRDGYFAYQLAVVLDDHAQGITEVVRGADLLETSGRHISLYQTLGLTPPKWAHLPLAVMANGQKLSKQNHAPQLSQQQVISNLLQALTILNQPLPENATHASPDEVIQFAINHFDWQAIPKSNQLIESQV